MKKAALTLCAVLSAGMLLAQVTITKTDMPAAGDTFRISTGLDTLITDPTLTGAGYSWDYSSLVALSQKVDTFVSASSTPITYYLSFNNMFDTTHKANLAARVAVPDSIGSLQPTNVYNYFKVKNWGYEQVGFAQTINGLPLPVTFDTTDMIYRFPMNYGNADSCTSFYKIDVPSLIYYSQKKHRVNEVDGWGTLVTPFGSFSVLRVKSTIMAHDSMFYYSLSTGYGFDHPLEIDYKWLGQGEGVPLLQINTVDQLGFPFVTSITYRDSARSTILGTGKINGQLSHVNVFPNPAASLFNVYIPSAEINALPGTYVFSMNDVLGREVMSANLSGRISRIDGGNLLSGIYFYRVTVSGKTIASGKVVME